ncbi:MAG: hypothetical protein NC231_01960 [Bacillus sp. (in: Bacteria)]|nr:hypothetical protein [Bacillus sp. (in: firmicutes)]MCM1428058.1 PIN domain-containing protein [Eubacterium sp.]
MKIYMDNCCYNRPFDDRTNIKNYLEREAVLLVFELAYTGQVMITGSEVLQKEIAVMSNSYRRKQVQLIYDNLTSNNIKLDADIIKRAKEIAHNTGATPFDSLHLAATEGNADIFLTTDMKLIKASKRADLPFKVMNPIEFVMEVENNE